MVIAKFPDIEQADEDGLLAVGGDLEPESLILAYSNAIFPWPMPDYPLLWFSPPKRAVFYTNKLKLPQSFKKRLAKLPFQIRCNTAFRQVISNCARAKNRKFSAGTWITDEMLEAYCHLHQKGLAFSIETFQGENLVGGLYGVNLGCYFSAESMFYQQEEASKVALLALSLSLAAEKINLFDVQVINPFTKKFGAEEIDRKHFVSLIKTLIKQESPKFLDKAVLFENCADMKLKLSFN